MDLRIRKASANDAAFLAWLILTAGRAHVKRGIWEVILNQPEDACIGFLKRLTITGPPHLFYHSCYIVADTDVGLVSGLGGYDSDTQGYPALAQALPEVYEKLGMLPPKRMTSGEPPRIAACLPPSIEGAWVIDSVATLPAFRRKEIVDRLLDNILDAGGERGYRLKR